MEQFQIAMSLASFIKNRKRSAGRLEQAELGDSLEDFVRKEQPMDLTLTQHVWRNVALPGGNVGTLERGGDRDATWTDADGLSCIAHFREGRLEFIRRGGWLEIDRIKAEIEPLKVEEEGGGPSGEGHREPRVGGDFQDVRVSDALRGAS